MDQAAQVRQLFESGWALHQKQQLPEALALYAQVLQLQPQHFDALHLSGIVAAQTRDLPRARQWMSQAINAHPRHAVAYVNRGAVLQDLGDLQAALDDYDSALARQQGQPGEADSHHHRGNVLKALSRYPEALESFDRAIALEPGRSAFHNNRGIALRLLGHYLQALAAFDQALALEPAYPQAFNNRANTLNNLGRHQEALESYDQAIALQPGFATFHTNRGNILQELRQPQAALQSYRQATLLDPVDAHAHWSLSLCLLQSGQFEEGWAAYESRWERAEYRHRKSAHFSRPRWRGDEPVQGKTILLQGEQGFGDTLQFCRYAAEVARLGGEVFLEVQKPLCSLMQGLAGVHQVIAVGDAVPAYDLQCPLLSLPLAFNTRLDTIPAAASYLRADPKKVAQWQGRLGPRTRPRVGLVWSGSSGHQNDRQRSIALAEFLTLLPEGVQPVSLQKDVREADLPVLQSRSDLVHFGDALVDFSDTAALCALVDGVVCVDTSVAHLAGALGRPVWLLLPTNPDWRWLLDRPDSPWYPSARLFRQAVPGQWGDVLQEVRQALMRLSSQGR
ncbi:MAG: tetratricopeptide repeat-containing glycosyltransferase family protein [Polaromonas sp.]|uniref:tetratricopeptide repeat-containing glycosyltransferase family protein n=1 Tax=Polaromonas sp. TaxID=1869339 RepID=UPI0027350FD0|nr:tetratricopeptide repeat-containing glycosyltransferase family protein [Polaromonas sp.]MDP2819997.1 tetratricopeptide repeat-containing glycosyltransferase family protein [Polaromonas sp.]